MNTSKTTVSTAPDKMTEGRILRIKHGYNPNSSSMGSMIFILPASLLAVTAGFGVISGIILSSLLRRPSGEVQKTADAPLEGKKQP